MSLITSSSNLHLDKALNDWLQVDKNAETRKEVLEDIEKKRWAKLEKCMFGRLKFGTAGLRGKMAAGFKCMNDVVVLQTAQGLCSYLKKECDKNQLNNGIVIGFDGRYNSKRFAELTAKVFVSSSIPVHLFSSVCPTPLVSFTTIELGCAAGVMVTASHNPKEDNGYKVYWGNGSQIIPQHDDNILDEILLNLNIPDEHWDISEIRSNSLVTDSLEDMSRKYNEYIAESLSDNIKETNRKTAVKTVYSAMHGVGYNYVIKAFDAAKLKHPVSVIEQQDPNPDFPTVKFPNPEETECLRLSCALAERERINLVLANDPDADRLAVAEYDTSAQTWKIFTGNEMGALLGWWVLRQNPSVKRGAVITSLVSSRLLGALAAKHNCQFIQTLTGFKWMGNATLELQKAGSVPLFAFEEAIGYMCGARVPDKDGVSAAVQVASLASHLYSEGSTLSSQLQAIYVECGYHVTHNSYYICHEPAVIEKIFKRIRNYEGTGQYPKSVCGYEITSIHDLTTGVKVPADTDDSSSISSIPPCGAGGEMVSLRAAGLSLTLRASGTEPKLKFYSEAVQHARTHTEQELIKEELVKKVQLMVEELFQPKENGLIG